MSHTIKKKEKLVLRAKRIQGQVEALTRALAERARLLAGSAANKRCEGSHE